MIPANSFPENEIAIPLPVLNRPALHIEIATRTADLITVQRPAHELHISGAQVLLAFTSGLGVIALFLWGFIRYFLFAQ
jgi:hypothetical protein